MDDDKENLFPLLVRMTDKEIAIQRPDGLPDEEWKKFGHTIRDALQLGFKLLMLQALAADVVEKVEKPPVPLKRNGETVN